MPQRSAPALPSAIRIAAVAALAIGAACGKHTESLIVVNLTTATPITNPGPVTLTVGGRSREYPVAALSSTPVSLGIYVPEGVTGPVDVTARVATKSCAGYDGSSTATIAAAGASVGTSITLAPTLRCNCREFDHRDSQAPACDLTANPAVGDVYMLTIAFSPDGSYLVTCGNDSRAKIWRFDGTTLTAEGHVIPIDGGGRVAFSPDGRLMAAVSWSARGNAVAIYDVPAFTLRQTLTGAIDFTIDVAFTPDSQHVIVLESNNVDDGRLLSFSLVSGNLATGPLGLDPLVLAVSPAAGTAGIPIAVASFEGNAGVYTLGTNGFSAPTFFNVTADASIAWSVAISPDGSLLAAGGEDAAFNLWGLPFTSTATGPPLVVGGGNGVNMLAFSPDSDFVAVAAGTFGREVSFWNIGSRSRLAVYEPSYVATAIAYAPGGRAVAGGELFCGKVFLCVAAN
jgi:WD40 repeat protein